MNEQAKQKILHGLDSCGFYDGVPNICELTECPYRGNKEFCVHELAHDAGILISKLLKEREPVQPVPGFWDKDIPLFNCGACGGEIGAGGLAKYCFHCGRSVKWDA